MALNVDNFIVPETDFGGLYKVGDDIAKKNAASETDKKNAAAQRLAASKYVQNTLGKGLFTGVPLDELYNQHLADTTRQANELISAGVDLPTVQTVISPLVQQMNDIKANATHFNDQIKSTLGTLGNVPGIDKTALVKYMTDNAFPIDPKTGKYDLTKYDPTKNYADDALQNGDVYNNAGLTDFVGKAGKISRNDNVKLTTANGAMRQTKADMTYPSFMQPDVDEKGVVNGFVPKYNIATDEDNKLIHTFGEQGDHPVRVVTDEVFNSMPANAQAYIRQEVRKLTKDKNIPLSSPQAETLAKAIAYDELLNNGKNYSSIRETQNTKEAPIDRFYAHWNYELANPKPGSQQANLVNDVYGTLVDNNKTADIDIKYPNGTVIKAGRWNTLPNSAQTVIAPILKTAYPDQDPNETYQVQQPDGKIILYKTDDSGKPNPTEANKLLVFDKTGINLKAPQTGVGAKKVIVAQGNKTTAPAKTTPTHKVGILNDL